MFGRFGRLELEAQTGDGFEAVHLAIILTLDLAEVHVVQLVKAGRERQVDRLGNREAQASEDVRGEGRRLIGILEPSVADPGADEGVDTAGLVQLVGVFDEGGAGLGVDRIGGDDVTRAQVEAEVGVFAEMSADADADDGSVVGAGAASERGAGFAGAELDVDGQGLGGRGEGEDCEGAEGFQGEALG